MGMLAGGGNAILLLLTVMTIGGAALIAILAHRRNSPRVTRTFAGGAGILGLAYMAGVIATSAASTEQTLPAGDVKWFCGFYLDCHLGMSIDRTEKLSSIPALNGHARPNGSFHVITVRLHNSARNPNIDMLLYRPRLTIVDALGRRYERSPATENGLRVGNRPPPLAAETKVTHDPVTATLVFDLPADVREPRLEINEGWFVDRIIELGLMGDENSLFHKRILFAIYDSASTTVARTAE